jgi:hypothetical protein
MPKLVLFAVLLFALSADPVVSAQIQAPIQERAQPQTPVQTQVQPPSPQTPPSQPPAAMPLPDAPPPASQPSPASPAPPAARLPNPYKRFLDTTTPVPLTPEQKARLALRNLTDIFNLATIVGTAGYTIASNSHTAYGPAWKGFGKDIGYSSLQDATGEFFGTFLISSIAREDPHYHRWPHRKIARRILHAINETFIAQNDQGKTIPNYAMLLTNPICAEISNLYVPGISGDGPSTAKRILIGYATDPTDNLITEFLPDLARHIHVRVIFVQKILNGVSSGQASNP